MRGLIGEVWFVRQQDHWLVAGDAAQSLRKIGGSAEDIVNPCQPEAGTFWFDRFGLVRQYVNPLGLKGSGDVITVSIVIVVTHDRPKAAGRGHLAQQAS